MCAALTLPPPQGIMDNTRTDNRFADFDLAYVMYCDGSSYTGEATCALILRATFCSFSGLLFVASLSNIENIENIAEPAAVSE